MILVIVSISAVRYYTTYGTLGNNLKKEVIECDVANMDFHIFVEEPVSNGVIAKREGCCNC